MTKIHSAAARENFPALEFHSADVAWWKDMVNGIPRLFVGKRLIPVPNALEPGLALLRFTSPADGAGRG
jgi:hypothetical protein